jgi:EAL domain-containing protein (putative c-di-GMP-specific phosphodiesterase class I)
VASASFKCSKFVFKYSGLINPIGQWIVGEACRQVQQQKVIAEGIETAEQLAFLKNLQCDEGQGYLFSHPLNARDFGRFLLNGGKPLNFQF